MVVADQDEVDPRQILEAHAGARTRRGPAKEKGEARSDQIGSVRMLRPCGLDQDRAVADPGDLHLRAPTRRGGTVGVTGTRSGQAARSSEPAQRLKKLRRPLAARRRSSGLKKRSPSKCALGGP